MLRSSIKRLGGWPLSAGERLAVAIGKREVAAAYAATGSNPCRIRWGRTAAVAEELFAGRPGATHAKALGDALVDLVAEARNRFVPVHVAIPDSLGTVAVFDLDSLPKGESLRRQLVRWRMAKEFGLAEAELDVAYQDFGHDDAKRLLLGQALDAGWLALIQEALAQARITPWSVNQAICFRFNGYHDRIIRDGGSGALLACDDDTWTVAVWDAAARLRFVRSRWRAMDREQQRTGSEQIADELERAVLAYVHGGAGRTVERIYISVAEKERDALISALNRRLQAPCMPLVPDAVIDSGGNALSAMLELALISAGTA